ncbi:GDSL-type esterase/lipase family protein [Halobacillus yeomjeoni]|uniref:SGNH hydrolase-type esterase domain-containing protein n=1 Tax=Halobacillus yeomjeoni TaxID=311194 RepID=A0A931HVH7_9BACI|nr:GDSL-type esterase/lipase family protein [Halobacillus yeomjeoni]MBH0230304.1 hypothetical protein [Halobacillus yeomjeoni]
MNWLKKLSVLMVVFIMFGSLAPAVYADGDEREVDYVALGDSVTAGMTHYGGYDLGYVDYLTAKMESSGYDVDFENFGVAGHTTSHLLSVLKDEDVMEEIEEAELITITIGANDFINALKTCDLTENEIDFKTCDPPAFTSALNNVSNNLPEALDKIKRTNPNANVYVMGYYNAFPYKSIEEQTQIIPLLNNLNSIIEIYTDFYGYTFIPTEEVIAQNYVKYLPNPADIHLSKEGYEVIADEFWKSIQKNDFFEGHFEDENEEDED